jgi:hypothetical protein
LKVIQEGGANPREAYTSIAISAACAGLSSATISYDFDVSPANRALAPDFYGYVPDDPLARSVTFLCLLVNSSLLLVIRSFSSALLLTTDTRFLGWYVLSDLGVFLLQKILRGDFWYWLPVDGPVGALVSLFARILVKNVTDYTGIVTFRNPLEMGGVGWTVNLIAAAVVPFAVIKLFFASNAASAIKEKTATTVMGSLAGIWLISLLLLLCLMDAKYRKTFFSLETGSQHVIARFKRRGAQDETKAKIIYYNRRLWSSIRCDVREFFAKNWEKWEEGQETWFDDNFKQKIDDDLIPGAILREMKMNGGGQRRRSSLGEQMLGAKGA